MTRSLTRSLTTWTALLAALLVCGCPGSKTDEAGKTAAKSGADAKTTTPTPRGKTYDDRNWALYEPADKPAGKRPIVVAFHPAANWRLMLERWSPIADKLGWYVAVSKTSKNGMQMKHIARAFGMGIDTLAAKHPIDVHRLATTGYSGGGMLSHYLAMTMKTRVRAVIPNTGIVHPKFRDRKNYPVGKIVAFIASPTDKRYAEMKGDRERLEALKWRTKWIEFKGGHVLAPYETCLEAATWVEETWR